MPSCHCLYNICYILVLFLKYLTSASFGSAVVPTRSKPIWSRFSNFKHLPVFGITRCQLVLALNHSLIVCTPSFCSDCSILCIMYCRVGKLAIVNKCLFFINPMMHDFMSKLYEKFHSCSIVSQEIYSFHSILLCRNHICHY